MEGGVIDIGYVELAAASLLMLVAGVVSWRLSLGQAKSIAVATVRAFVQLLAMGFLLVYVFQLQSWWLVLLILLLMTLAATQIAADRVGKRAKGLWASMFLTLLVSSLTIALIVVDGVIRPEVWYSARQLIPITGMALGNTMSAAAVAVDRLYADMDARSSEIFALVALGATPKEAAFPSIKAAVAAGMMPTLASMSAAGIVQIPGMMSGQILAGANPVIAAKYQIVVLLMISAATTLGIVMICFLAYRKRFSQSGYFVDAGLR